MALASKMKETSTGFIWKNKSKHHFFKDTMFLKYE